jgi:SAM-dependent methyltransferase
MLFLKERCSRPEEMDRLDISPERHLHALRGLARLNRWSRSAAVLWPLLARKARTDRTRPFKILDVASGGGDVTVSLARKADKTGLPMHFAGCDLSPRAVAYAQNAADAAATTARFFVHDVLAEPLPTGFDAVICSLFLHHLSESDAVGLLRRMAAAAPLVLVNDLRRGLTSLTLVRLATRLLSRSDIVHNDGVRSVEGAFTPREALDLAHQAGLKGATVAKRWPCRFLLTWSRD